MRLTARRMIAGLALGGMLAWAADEVHPAIRVTTADGQAVQLLAEDLAGIRSRPLVKLQEAMEKEFRWLIGQLINPL